MLGALAAGITLVAPTAWMAVRYPNGTVNKADVGLVLGAGLYVDGTPSPVLRARVLSGVSLYEQGLVRKLVMSGDNSRDSYDEVSAMKQLAIQNGVSSDDVLLDYAGFRTLDSCVRIRKVFGQQEIIVVSQSFHLGRALFLCADAGVKATGYAAEDPRPVWDRRQSSVRELAARWQAVIDAKVLDKQPKFLGDVIDIDNPPPEALEQPGGSS